MVWAFSWRIIPKAFRIKTPWESWNYQKKQTIKTAERLWEDIEPEKDFSDLVEQLLVNFIETQHQNNTHMR